LAEVCVIQEVEKLSPNIKMYALAPLRDLHDGKIGIAEPWSDDHISPGAAEP